MKISKLPVHVAIIMDGNGRWAKKRKMPRVMGHREGAKSVRAVTEACAETGIKYLTLYAFSTENWKRPKKEVGFLMSLLSEYLDKEKKTLMKNNIVLETIGCIEKLPAKVRKKIREVRKITAKNTGMTLILALNYGSKAEIVMAVKKIAAGVKKGRIKPGGINEELISKNLYTSGFPDPDLLIRTGNEMRISNFLLWQIAYTELWVTPLFWPEFTKGDFFNAVLDYQKRKRRFGGIK